MQFREKLLSNTIFLSMDWFSLTFFSFLFWFILGKTLLVEEYGIVATSINFILIVSWVSLFGISGALHKLIPELIERKTFQKVFSLIKLSLKIVVSLSLFIGLVLFIFSSQLSALLKIPYNAFLIVIIAIISYSIFVLLGSVLFGFQKMRRLFITDLYQSITKVTLVLVLVLLGWKFFGALVGFMLSYGLILFLRLDKKFFQKTSAINPNLLFSYSIPGFISTIAISFITYSQYIILTILKNTEVTGLFAVAFLLSNLLSAVPSILLSAAFPIISGISIHRKTKVEQGYIIGLVLRYALLFVIPLATIFLLFSNFVVLSFSRADFLSATSFFPILIPAAIFFGLGNIFLYNIYAIGKPKISRNITIITAVLFLSLAIPLVFYLSSMGLSIAYFISMFVFFSINFYWIRRFLKVKFFVSDTIKILISAFLISLIILFIFKQFVYNFITFALFSLISLFSFFFILFLIKFFRKEDLNILLYLEEKLPHSLKRIIKFLYNIISKRLQS